MSRCAAMRRAFVLLLLMGDSIQDAQAAPLATPAYATASTSSPSALPLIRWTAMPGLATVTPAAATLQPGAQPIAPFVPRRTAMSVEAGQCAKDQPDCGGVDCDDSSAVFDATATESASYVTVTATWSPGHRFGGGGDENGLRADLETLSASSSELDNESGGPDADEVKDHNTNSTNASTSTPAPTQEDTYHIPSQIWLGGLASVLLAAGCCPFFIIKNCRYIKVEMTPDGLGIGAASFNIGDEHTSATALGLLNGDRAWPPALQVSATQGGRVGGARESDGGNREDEEADRAGEGTDDGGEDGSRGEDGGMDEGRGGSAPQILLSSIFARLTGR